jgi:hypothetical protein
LSIDTGKICDEHDQFLDPDTPPPPFTTREHGDWTPFCDGVYCWLSMNLCSTIDWGFKMTRQTVYLGDQTMKRGYKMIIPIMCF